MRTRSLLRGLLLALLLAVSALTVAPPTAAPAVAQDEIATTTTVTATSAKPHQLTFDVTVTGADGSTPEGWVYFAFADVGEFVPISGGSLQKTYKNEQVGDLGAKFGDVSYTVEYHSPSGSAYAASSTDGIVRVLAEPTNITFDAENAGRGVVGLHAYIWGDDVIGWTWGEVVFQVDDLAPISVPLGSVTVVTAAGEQVSSVRNKYGIANLFVTGLPVRGTHHVSATWVPHDPADARGGASDEADVDMTVSIDQAFGALAATSPRPHTVDFKTRAGREPWSELFVGKLTLTDLTTGKQVAAFATKNGQLLIRKSFTRTGISAGVHTYKLTYTPAASIKDVLRGFSITKRVRVSG